MALYYLDTSAAFKLLAAEEHAEAFLAFYREHRSDSWISSDLLRIEVSRAVTRNWPALIPDAQRLLDAFEYVQIDEDVVRSAIVEPDRLLRSLDAIHLATARILGPELTALLTYDDRLAKAAADAGISVLAPVLPDPRPGGDSLPAGRARLCRKSWNAWKGQHRSDPAMGTHGCIAASSLVSAISVPSGFAGGARRWCLLCCPPCPCFLLRPRSAPCWPAWCPLAGTPAGTR